MSRRKGGAGNSAGNRLSAACCERSDAFFPFPIEVGFVWELNCRAVAKDNKNSFMLPLVAAH